MREIVTLRLKEREEVAALRERAARELGVSVKKLRHFKILKLSLDARDKGAIRWQYRLEAGTEEDALPPELPLLSPPADPVVIVGAGPAGLFCALRLARRGLRPVVLERGDDVDARRRAVGVYAAGGSLDEESNVQFGEGGAGTFSDGKLNTQTNSPLNRVVLEEFVRAGAPEEILYLSKPHIGSDLLPSVVANLRKTIEALGGEVRFRSRADGFTVSGGRVTGVRCGGKVVSASAVVLAVGHSARDTFRVLHGAGVLLEPKGFAVGVRVEHPQRDIDVAQYGCAGVYPPADYKLAARSGEGRGVFTFCMCPGGSVVAAASEAGGVTVNGMSDYARAGTNANAAVVVEVRREDFGGDPFAGVAFQQKLERAAFAAGGGEGRAPYQLAGDFMKGAPSSGFGEVLPTYPRGVTPAPLHKLLPDFVVGGLREGLSAFGRKIRGYDRADALLTGVETRTSSPLRVTRGENLTALGFDNLYPAGEGCGYAGGIMSAAADGLRVADAVICGIFGAID